jgi:16S rRNA (guanine527-N7)-methyltransferase
MNLTSLPLDPTSVPTINRLFIEPAVASALVEDTRLVAYDLGSGGGSPGIPLNVFRSELQLTMVESRERKCAFLREAVREVGLDAAVLNTRFEDLQMEPETDLVVLRAVRLDGSLLAMLHSQLKQGARVMVFGAKETPPLFRPVEFCQLPNGSYVTVLARA